MDVEKYLERLINQNGIYSILTYFDRSQNFINLLLKKTFKIGFSHSELKEGAKPTFKEIIFETSHPFYIHVKEKKSDEWSMNIYYKPEQHKELIFFLNQLEKK